MKKLLLILLTTFTLSCCDKDDGKQKTELEKLPPATQTGAQTFGCLIDGKAFVPPKFGTNSPNAFYQFVNGKYFLGISASVNSNFLKSIGIGSDAINIVENSTYNFLQENQDNPAFYAKYLLGGGIYGDYSTTNINSGTIKITRFDSVNFIISGTFNFTAKEIYTGEIVEITNGRFDMQYTN